MSAVTASPPSP